MAHGIGRDLALPTDHDSAILSSPMLAAASKPSAAGSSPSRPLPLESGEWMHSCEFLRRYEHMSQVKKAELIEGVVSLGSPVSVRHSKADALMQGRLVAYAGRHPEAEAHTNATVILDAENTVQPDALLRRLPEYGGHPVRPDETSTTILDCCPCAMRGCLGWNCDIDTGWQ